MCCHVTKTGQEQTRLGRRAKGVHLASPGPRSQSDRAKITIRAVLTAGVWVGLNAGTQGFPLEHCSVAMINAVQSSVSGYITDVVQHR